MDKDNKRHEYVLSSNAVQALNEWLEERASCDIGRDDDHMLLRAQTLERNRKNKKKSLFCKSCTKQGFLGVK
jgi:hypothetical protein